MDNLATAQEIVPVRRDEIHARVTWAPEEQVATWDIVWSEPYREADGSTEFVLQSIAGEHFAPPASSGMHHMARRRMASLPCAVAGEIKATDPAEGIRLAKIECRQAAVRCFGALGKLLDTRSEPIGLNPWDEMQPEDTEVYGVFRTECHAPRT